MSSSLENVYQIGDKWEGAQRGQSGMLATSRDGSRNVFVHSELQLGMSKSTYLPRRVKCSQPKPMSLMWVSDFRCPLSPWPLTDATERRALGTARSNLHGAIKVLQEKAGISNYIQQTISDSSNSSNQRKRSHNNGHGFDSKSRPNERAQSGLPDAERNVFHVLSG